MNCLNNVWKNIHICVNSFKMLWYGEWWSMWILHSVITIIFIYVWLYDENMIYCMYGFQCIMIKSVDLYNCDNIPISYFLYQQNKKINHANSHNYDSFQDEQLYPFISKFVNKSFKFYNILENVLNNVMYIFQCCAWWAVTIWHLRV